MLECRNGEWIVGLRGWGVGVECRGRKYMGGGSVEIGSRRWSVDVGSKGWSGHRELGGTYMYSR